jgi:hypothetical protein
MIWLYMAEVWPNYQAPPDAEAESIRFQVWADVLGDLEAGQIRGAIVKLAREPFPPTVGALREAVLALTGAADGSAAPDIDQAWAEVMAGIQTYGFSAGPPDWSHPAITAAVEAVTWRRLCLDDNLGMLHAHFRDFYRPAAARTEAARILPDAARQLVAGDDLARTLAARARELDA